MEGFRSGGMLLDVYVARFRNAKKQYYGFARFTNVRDVDKLNKILKMFILRIGDCMQIRPVLIG